MGFVIEIRSDPRLNLEVQMVSRQHPLRYTYTKHTGSRLGWSHQPDHTPYSYTRSTHHILVWQGHGGKKQGQKQKARARESEAARRLCWPPLRLPKEGESDGA